MKQAKESVGQDVDLKRLSPAVLGLFERDHVDTSIQYITRDASRAMNLTVASKPRPVFAPVTMIFLPSNDTLDRWRGAPTIFAQGNGIGTP